MMGFVCTSEVIFSTLLLHQKNSNLIFVTYVNVIIPLSSFTGVDLVTACDIRLCTQDAWFQVKVWTFLLHCHCDFNEHFNFKCHFRINLGLNFCPFLFRRLTLVWQLMSGLCNVYPEWLEVEGTCLILPCFYAIDITVFSLCLSV